ncbi:MAG: hypothetical protein ABFD96_01725 [Armatimonadia bacterium]
MCKRSVILLTGIVLALLLPLAAQAQDGPMRGWRGRGGNSRAAALFEDIMLLQRLAPLQLTDAQLDAIAAAYQKQPQVAAEQTGPLAELAEIKRRLLAGNPAVAADQQALRQIMQKLQRAPEPSATEPTLSPLAVEIWGLLTQTQRAALLGDVRQAAANNQRADQQAALRAIKTLGQLRELDQTQWVASRDRIAQAFSENAGAPDTPARQNCQKMFVEFLDRFKTMSDVDFAAKQGELATELLALLPPGTNLTVAMATYDQRLLQNAMNMTFLNPRLPDLLKEMKAARAAQGG